MKTVLRYLGSMALGGILMHFLRVAEPVDWALWSRNDKLDNLKNCNLCLGFWVFTFVSLSIHFNEIKGDNALSTFVNVIVHAIIMDYNYFFTEFGFKIYAGLE